MNNNSQPTLPQLKEACKQAYLNWVVSYNGQTNRMSYREDEAYTLAFKAYIAAVRAAGPDALRNYYIENNANPNL